MVEILLFGIFRTVQNTRKYSVKEHPAFVERWTGSSTKSLINSCFDSMKMAKTIPFSLEIAHDSGMSK